MVGFTLSSRPAFARGNTSGFAWRGLSSSTPRIVCSAEALC
jgi:hypothetical protein